MLIRNPPEKTPLRRIIKIIFYWGIPVIILIYIFRTIDVHQLFLILKTANSGWVILGFFIFPGIVILGAYRWKSLLARYLNHSVGFWFILRVYWIGLAIGKFFPGSVTWDIYRVMVTGRKFGDYPQQITVVLLEKLAAVIMAVLLILSLYPFVFESIPENTIPLLIKNAFPGGLNETISRLYGPLTGIFFIVFAVLGYIAVTTLKKQKINWKQDLIIPLSKPGIFTPLLLSSLFIYIGTAIANYYFFCALNTPIAFLIHLFLMPVFAVLLILPVTFAGMGVREGSFIILYGLFGIPMETALIVSFMNLTANLINSAIGGIMMLTATPKN